MINIQQDSKIDSLLSVLSNNYEALYFVDFDNDTVEPYRLSKIINNLFGDYLLSKPKYSEAMKLYIEKSVADSDREHMMMIADPEYIKNKLKDRKTFSYDFSVERDGKLTYFRFKISKLDDGDEIHKAVVGFADISLEMENISELRESAALLSIIEKDSLTGLYSKEIFFKKADKYIEEHPDEDLLIWAADVQGLKIINEKYGESMGDEVLRLSAESGMNGFPGFIMGGRIEGDKFCALTYDLKPDIKAINEMINNGSTANFPVPNVIIKHGIYHVGKNNPTKAQGMYDRAMLALNSIKDNYGVNIAEYDDNIRKELLLNRLIMENAETGLEKNEFHIFYQQKHDAYSGEVVGAEALVRWIHPELGFMSPALFIPLFEKNGFISKMDYFVWDRVCANQKEWINKGLKIVPVSVNVSRRDFDNPEVARKIIDLVDSYGLEHSMIHIEVTESAYSDNPKTIIDEVKTLHDAGFVVELDDFGTGYSSMMALGSMDLDIMKLDMSLIQEEDLESEKSLLKFSMQLAQMMQLKTVAEGVETEAQADRIRELGGDVIQGYLYSKPISEEEFEKALMNN